MFGRGRSGGRFSVRGGAHDYAVPRISFFYGIVVTMYFYDHDPPHFHAEYAEHHAAIVIGSIEVLVGSLPSRALKLVTEWASLHRDELEADWQRAKDGGSPSPSTRCRKMEAWSSYASPL